MSTHNIYFCGAVRKISTILVEKCILSGATLMSQFVCTDKWMDGRPLVE